MNTAWRSHNQKEAFKTLLKKQDFINLYTDKQ